MRPHLVRQYRLAADLRPSIGETLARRTIRKITLTLEEIVRFCTTPRLSRTVVCSGRSGSISYSPRHISLGSSRKEKHRRSFIASHHIQAGQALFDTRKLPCSRTTITAQPCRMVLETRLRRFHSIGLSQRFHHLHQMKERHYTLWTYTI